MMTDGTFAKTQNRRVLLQALIIACGVFLIGQLCISLFYKTKELSEDLRLTELASEKSWLIEQQLASTLMATRMLEVQLRLNDGHQKNFNRYAPVILSTTPGVSNIQLAPDGIVTHIYPLAGNEQAIGHNILQDDRRRDIARKAISTRKMTLAGPFNLIQGGVAVIGRQPIFIEDGRQEAFWGFASAMIRLEALLKAARFQELESQGFTYELTHKEPGSDKIKPIKTSAKPLGDRWHQQDIQVPNGFWTLKVGLSEQGNRHHYVIVSSLLAIVSLGIFLITLYLLKKPGYLRQQIRDLQNQNEQLAAKDPLTEMHNRQSLMQELGKVQRNMGEKPSLSALMVINLDNFRAINENLGSDKGDKLLSLIGKRLCALTRDNDIAARIGGDEFAVLIRGIHNQNDAEMMADQLLKSIRLPAAGLSDRYPVTASIGITLIQPGDISPDQVLLQADQAMRLARQNGSARYYVAQPFSNRSSDDPTPD